MKVLCFGETLLRYASQVGSRMQDLQFKACVGGSETNIAVNLSQMDIESSLFTKLSENPLGQGVLNHIRSKGVETSTIIRSDKRQGIYYLETGVGNRSSQVLYDRSDSAMTTLTKEEVDLDQILKNVRVFVTSGITAALNQELRDIILEMMQYASKHNITVVYDSNYRSRLWSQEAAGECLRNFLPYINILSASSLDFELLLHLEHKENWQDYCQSLQAEYPNIQLITCTKRENISASTNNLTGYVYTNKQYVSPTHHIENIVDRVGGGDAFIAGLIYGYLKFDDPQTMINYAVSSAVLKHTVYGDCNQFNAQEIIDYMNMDSFGIKR